MAIDEKLKNSFYTYFRSIGCDKAEYPALEDFLVNFSKAEFAKRPGLEDSFRILAESHMERYFVEQSVAMACCALLKNANLLARFIVFNHCACPVSFNNPECKGWGSDMCVECILKHIDTIRPMP